MNQIRPKIIKKSLLDLRVPPNLKDYGLERQNFSWEKARLELGGLPGGGLNIAYEAIDRHALAERKHHPALRWIGKKGDKKTFTYLDLASLTNRFANVLKNLGVRKGDRLFILTGRIPELYVAAMGAFKNGTVVSPLFSAFGPEPIQTRISLGDGSVLVTTEFLYKRKIEKIISSLPQLKHILLIGEDSRPTNTSGTLDFSSLMDQATEKFEIENTQPEDVALLHFTSGTTGTPKGAIHVHEAVVTHYATGKYALDLHPEDIFWCTADPGWVTGTSYGIIAPLLHGVTSIVDESEFDAEHWYRILQEQNVSVWYTAPTAIRMLMKAGIDTAKKFQFKNLRFIASVGEPLNPEAVWWGVDAFGLPIHDNWWQTETGGIMISNFPALDIKPGSMGKPLPGIAALIVSRQQDGNVKIITESDTQGELALRTDWPSMFRGYLHQEERYKKCFFDDLYLTGDLAKRDEDGYFWFVGRTDDVIKSAGHLIGPFEVESALMEHPAVAEAGVIGKPDPVIGEMVKAFVALKSGVEPNEDLRMELLGFARTRLGAAVAPKEIDFIATLPKTRSGKIMRRLLKARELGLPEGDTSTLEEGT